MAKPILAGFSTPITFLENTVNGAPQIIDADVTFTDADNDFNGAALTVSGLLAEDSVAIRNQGTGAGQIGTSGANVTFGGTIIGSFTGGAGSTLSVTFNAAATAAGIEALIENLTYANSSNTPTASRSLELKVSDAAGGAAIAPTFAQQAGAADPFNGVDVGAFSTPSFTDLDGDGDLDAVVGESLGRVRYYENTGTTIAPAFIEQTGAANPFDGVEIEQYSAPSLADLDDDGDFDAVVGGHDGTLRYFKNTGSAIAPAFTEQAGAANPFDGVNLGIDSAPNFADLDGDGDLDAVVGSDNGALRYFENTGSAIAPVFAEQTGAANPFDGFDVGAYSTPSFADLDDDGDLDAVVGVNVGTLHYFENTGSAIAPTFVARIGAAIPFDGFDIGTGSAPSFADLDGDGDPDAVIGERSGLLFYFSNITPQQSTPQFTQQTGAANPFNGIDVELGSAPSFADLDGDGDLDAIIGLNFGNLRYFKNTGSAVAPAFTEQADAANPFNGVSVGTWSTPSFSDLDADGDLDAIIGTSDGTLHYFENTGTALAPTFTARTGAANPFNSVDVGSWSNPSFSDLDADGDLDAIVGNSSGNLRYFENTGSAIAPAFTQQTGAANPFNGIGGSYSRLAFADIDGDGDLDAVNGEGAGGLRYFANTGSATTPVFTERTGTANPFNGVNVGNKSSPSFGDLDGDGDPDLTVGAQDGTLRYFKNTGAGLEFVVNVTAENDAPTITSNGGNATAAVSVAENGTAVTTVTATDPEPGSTLSYAIVPGGDGARFSIGLTSGALAFKTAPNFEAPTDAGANNVYDVTVQVSDGAGGIDTQFISVTVTDVPTNAVLSGLATSATFLENTVNGAPQILDADVTFTASDNNFDGGRLTVSRLLAEDTVAIQNQGSGAGQIGVAGSTVSFGGTTIGSFTGGAGSTLTVTFNAAATAAGIEALIENLTYANSSDAPTASRTLALEVTDAAGVAATGQIAFVAQTGAANPLDGVRLGLPGSPAASFADLDSDGDLDAVVGDFNGNLFYFENTGSAIAPAFTERTGAANPFNGIDVGSYSRPNLADIDGDGDLDAVVGEINGSVLYLENTGSANLPAFVARTGAANPFNAVGGGLDRCTPSLADLDGDGDLDVVVGETLGLLYYHENTGSAVAPAFTARTGAANPFNGIDVGFASAPSFADIDGDGDFDAVVGEQNGTLRYFENTGSAIAPAFTARTGAANPLNLVSVGIRSSPSFADLDGDGDLDVFVGSRAGNLSYFGNTTQQVVVNVTAENDAPTITSNGGKATASVSIAENSTAVTTVTATDPDAGATQSYTIVPGGDGALFSIGLTSGVLTFTVGPDFEAPTDVGADNVYDVTVQVSDGAGGIDTQVISVTVTNVNAAPAITSGATAAVAENVSTSTVVYDAAATDDGEDSGSMTFSLSAGGDNDLFKIDATTGEVSFKASPNFEAPGDAGGDNVYDIVVRASDGVLSATKAVAITVTDVNAAPVITSGATATAAENAPTATVVYDAAATDDGEDSGVVIFSLSAGGDNDLFKIDAATGEVTFKVSPNYEAPGDAGGDNVYDIVVHASDGVLDTTRAVAITVTDVNLTPVITSGPTATVEENVATSAVVYDAAAADDGEDSGSMSFSLWTGGDNVLFDIDAATGEVTFKVSPNHEAPGDLGKNNVYDILIVASDGVLADTKAVSITVTDVNAAPVITSGSTATVAENVSTAAVVYDAAAQDDGEDSGSLTFSLSAGGDNDLFKIDATTGEVTFKVSPDYEAPGDAGGDNFYDIVVHASDGMLAATRAVAITVTNLNTAPVIVSGSTAMVAENVSTAAVVYHAAAQDDGEDSGSVTFSLSAGGDNDLFDIDATTGEVTFKVSPNFEAPGDVGGNNVYDIVVHASDGVLATTRAVAITVTNVNAAPVITSGAAATAAENVSTSAVVYDAAAVDDGEGSGTATFSLSAGGDNDLFKINAATGEVTFRTSPNFEAPGDAGGNNVYDIVVHASDGLLSATRAVAITVTNVNVAPVIVSAAAATVAENASTSEVVYDAAAQDDGEDSGNLTYALSAGGDNDVFKIDAVTGEVTFKTSPDYEAPGDVDGDNVYDIVIHAIDGVLATTRAGSITVTNVNEAPIITSGATATVAENVSTAVVVYETSVVDDGESGRAVTFSLVGQVDDARFDIDPATGAVTFKASPDYEAPSDAGADNVYDIVVQASDGLLTTLRPVRITVTNVNAAPVITSGSTATAAENVSTLAEVYRVAVTDDGESGSAVTFSLGGGVDDNRFAIDPTTGVVTFKATPDYEAPSDAGADNVYDIVVRASDGLQTATRSVAITVANVNAAPVIGSGSTATVAENVSTATEVYKTSIQNSGESTGAIIFSLGGGADDNRFIIDLTTGAVSFKAAPDYEAPADAGADNVYDIVVQASDGVQASAKAVAITVTNVNAAPAITSGTTATVAENFSTVAEVYKVSVTDDGESGSAVIFSLGGGVDDNRFTMDATTGVVTFKASPDYEAPSDVGDDNVYDIVVRASDGLSATMQSVRITVTDVNAAPVITSGSTATVSENVLTSAAVYKASVTDDGESGSAVTFSLGGGVDDSRFTIDPTTGVVTFKASPDYEAPADAGADNVYDIVVRASDGLQASTKAVSITVTNVTAAPVIVSGTTATAAENVSTVTEVYKASATHDGEIGGTVTFSLDGGVDDNRFAIDPTTGVVTFKASPDYEAPSDAGADNVYDIVVLASDGLQTAARSVAITVTNVNTAPVITSGATATVAENVPTSTQVYKASVTDDGESGSAVTFSLSGGADDNRFTIDPTTGGVTFKASPDYEAPSDAGADNVYDIVVLASDGLQTVARSVAITVTNVNAAPVIISGATATVAENVSASTEVYKAEVTHDGESGSAVAFSLGGGVDDSRFAIDPTTGVVTFKASPDFEAPSDPGADNVYDIVVLASDGLQTAMRSVAITVTNVNAAPVITSGATATVAENVSTSTQVYKASVTDDGESGSAVTFSLGGGLDDSRFTIDSTTGAVTFKAPPNYEAPSDAEADNVYDIVVQASDGLATAMRSVSITVSNVVEAANAVDDAYVLIEGSTLIAGPAGKLLLNDDVSGLVPAALVAGPDHGTLQFAADGGFSYAPDAGFSGIDSFKYGIVDGSGIGHVAEARIYITPVNVGASTTLDLLALTAEEQVAATYVALLGRAADAAGFTFWVDQFNDGLPTQGPGLLFANIASSFGISDEAKALYPFLASPFEAGAGLITDFVESVYDNLFNRSADAGGLAYWTGQIQQTLASGRFVGSVLVDMISGAQDTAAGRDITTLMSKVAVSLAFVREQQESSMPWLGSSDVAAARQLLDGVSGDQTSVLMGMKNADNLVELHP